MAQIGVEVHIALTKSGGPLEADLLDTVNVHIHRINAAGLGGKLKYLLQLRSIIKFGQFDAVYGFLPVPNLALLVARTVQNRPIIAWGVRSSGLDLTQYNRRVKWTMKLEKWLSKLSNVVITNSEAALEEYRRSGYPIPKLQHVPNAIDVDRFKPDTDAGVAIRNELKISTDVPVIGLFARIHPMKDHKTFINAAKILVDLLPDVRFICAGATSEGYSQLESDIKKRALDLDLDKHILWLGSRNDPEKLISACNITTLTSDSGEGFPNAVAESAACGVLCVATDIGDTSTIVSDVIPVVPAKKPDHLANAWKSALELDPADKGQITVRLRQSIIERFSCETIAHLTLKTLIP
jgi:glycosyltransferase involved in cell wall biosynthesis